MATFFSKVFPRKKDKETSNKRNSASSLLEGKFEAVSPTVSPSAANFVDSAQKPKDQGREKEKEKEKESAFSLFRPRSRPVSPPPSDTRKTASDVPHLTLNLPVPKEQRSRALGVVFEADPNDTTTKLLTLLNVSATKSVKRKRFYDALVASEPKKINRRKSVRIEGESSEGTPSRSEKGEEIRGTDGRETKAVNGGATESRVALEDEKDDDCEYLTSNFFERHG